MQLTEKQVKYAKRRWDELSMKFESATDFNTKLHIVAEQNALSLQLKLHEIWLSEQKVVLVDIPPIEQI